RFALPQMTVAFLGLIGPSGVLPRHYTELLMRQEKEDKGPEAGALRAWIDLFNHRLIALFYRAWTKYRFFIQYERDQWTDTDPDSFSRCLFSLVGLGLPALRKRLTVVVKPAQPEPRPPNLAAIDDLALLHYSGLFSHRPRSAVGLRTILQDYFGLPIQIR